MASFRVGLKELYLPQAMLTLCRQGNPYAAKFKVPLWFSKLDIRDYLYHAYNIEILSVRSYVKQGRVDSRAGNSPRPVARRWHRRRSTKYMTVELTRPFTWPEQASEDLKEWNMAQVKEQGEQQEAWQMRTMSSDKDAKFDEERRERMREQAKALLEGKARWKPAQQQRGAFR